MWTYQDKLFTAIHDKRLFGFIYRIDNITNSRAYIGQKRFYSKSGKYYQEADWQAYTGSNKSLNADIANGHEIKKTILQFCVTINEMNYKEAATIINENALLDDRYYNDWINIKVTNKDKKKWKQ